MINPADFGVIGDGIADDATALQSAVDEAAVQHTVVDISGLMCKLSSPINMERNSGIVGDLYGFKSGLLPQDCPALIVDGSLITGGFIFNVILRNFTIWNKDVTNAIDYSVLTNYCYRSIFQDIRIIGSNISSNNISNVLDIKGIQNANTYQNIIISGTGNNGSGACINIKNTGGTVVLKGADTEHAYRGIYCEPNARADIYSPYMERCGTGIRIMAGSTPTQTPHINIHGGTIDLASSTSVGIAFEGTFENNEMINIDGVRFSSNDHDTKNNAIVTSAMTWNNKNKIILSGLDWSWIKKPYILNTTSVINDH